MISNDFNERWRWITQRAGGETNVVQERQELEHIYNLMLACTCQSYLEVGSAEGTSLYVLGHIPSDIAYIDFGEDHTKEQRQEVLKLLGKDYAEYLGDSRKPETFLKKVHADSYDCVLIDGGHDYDTVMQDSICYAPLAKKYVFWHDVQLPQVKRAVDNYRKKYSFGTYNEFINSTHYGYGILEVTT